MFKSGIVSSLDMNDDESSTINSNDPLTSNESSIVCTIVTACISNFSSSFNIYNLPIKVRSET